VAGKAAPVQTSASLAQTMRDRLVDWTLAATFLVTAALVMLGSYTLVRRLGGWDSTSVSKIAWRSTCMQDWLSG
jgi:hypothetical protein